MVSLWAKAGKPRYQEDEASVVFISDVGATYKVSSVSDSSCSFNSNSRTIFPPCPRGYSAQCELNSVPVHWVIPSPSLAPLQGD